MQREEQEVLETNPSRLEQRLKESEPNLFHAQLSKNEAKTVHGRLRGKSLNFQVNSFQLSYHHSCQHRWESRQFAAENSRTKARLAIAIGENKSGTYDCRFSSCRERKTWKSQMKTVFLSRIFFFYCPPKIFFSFATAHKPHVWMCTLTNYESSSAVLRRTFRLSFQFHVDFRFEFFFTSQGMMNGEEESGSSNMTGRWCAAERSGAMQCTIKIAANDFHIWGRAGALWDYRCNRPVSLSKPRPEKSIFARDRK